MVKYEVDCEAFGVFARYPYNLTIDANNEDDLHKKIRKKMENACHTSYKIYSIKAIIK